MSKTAETRTLSELSSVTGSTASQVANRTGHSVSTARKHLAALRERGLARRDSQTGEWFTVAGPAAEQPPKPKRERKPVPAATPDAELEDTLRRSLPESHDSADVEAFLVGLGLSARLARQDAPVVQLLRDVGPLSEAEVEEKLDRTVPGWTFRRLTEGRHGTRRFDPVLEVTGRGDERKYQAVTS